MIVDFGVVIYFYCDGCFSECVLDVIDVFIVCGGCNCKCKLLNLWCKFKLCWCIGYWGLVCIC